MRIKRKISKFRIKVVEDRCLMVVSFGGEELFVVGNITTVLVV